MAGVVGGLALAVAACGSGANGSGGGATSSGDVTKAKALLAKYSKVPTAINQKAALPKPAPSGKKIIYLQQNGVPSIVAIGDAVQQAASDLGWSLSRINYDPSSPASLQNAFSSALVQKPDAVMVTGLAPDLYGQAVINDYQKAGIPIIVGAAGPVTNTATILGTAASPDSSAFAARRLADWFVADSNGAGKALFVHIGSFTTLAAEAKSLADETSSLCPGCSIKTLNVTLDQVSSGQVPAAVVSALQADPSIGYVLYDDGDWAGGITAALKAAGMSKIKVAGVTATAEQFQALQSGTQSAWTGYNFAYNGYGLVDIAVRHFEGVPVTDGDSIMPTQILTPSNVGNTTSWTEPADALAQFEKLWKIK